MEVKKDIGKAFREKLDGLDRQPGDALWNSISTELDKKKKRKFPFFWFYITTCTLIAIGVVAFIISNVTSTGNTSITNKPADTTNQIQIPGSSEVTSVENHSENKNTATGVPSANGTTTPDNKNADASTGVNTTINGDTSNGNSVKNNSVKNNTTQKSSNGLSRTEKVVFQKNSTQENSATAAKTRRQKAHLSGRNAVANSQTINTPKSKNKRSDSSVLPQDANASSTPESKRRQQAEDEHSDTIAAAATNDLKANNKKENTTSEKQTGNSSENREPTVSTVGNSEIAGREKAPTAVRDSLSENIPATKDSLTTETPKDEVAAEEKKENKKDSIRPSIPKRLSVFAFGGPSFFSFPGNTIKTDSTTANISTANPLRYGVLLGYRINEKFSIRAGVSFYKVKQTAKNLKLNYTMGGSAINPVLIPPTDFDWLDYNSGTDNASVITALGNDNRAIINIDRELSYIEIPLEATYSIYSKKFGINLIAGGSMLLLSKNEVTASNANGQLQLGEWNAAKKTSFTGTFGLGLNYKITPSLQLNAEPVFNYYFNTYSDSKPYSFTFRVGLQYNFDF